MGGLRITGKAGGFAAKTFSPDLKGKDWASYLDLSYWSDIWVIDMSYTDIGENFNAEMGFIPRTDIRKIRANIYFIYNETRKLGATGYIRDRVLIFKASFLFH